MLAFVFNLKHTKKIKKNVFACVWGVGALEIHLLAKGALAWKSLGTTDVGSTYFGQNVVSLQLFPEFCHIVIKKPHPFLYLYLI